MAELYVAKKLADESLCVIKRILPHLSAEAEFVQMFLDEAKIASQLHHENIVEVFDLGTQDGTYFMAMEYLDGIDLRRALQIESRHNRALPPHIVAYLGTRVCSGLYTAHHQRGLDGIRMELIHRDVTPQNVMALYDGRVKLVDFGIAKAGAFMAQSKPGVIKGKFLYLAPEQLGDEPVDRRADIFALGALLYEAVTGVSPFSRQNSEAVLHAIRSEAAVPPHQVRAGCPKALSDIILRCLEKKPENRIQEANAVQGELQNFLDQHRPTDRRDLQDYLASLAHQDTSRLRVDALSALASVGRRVTRNEASLPPPPVEEETAHADVGELRRKFGQDEVPQRKSRMPVRPGIRAPRPVDRRWIYLAVAGALMLGLVVWIASREEPSSQVASSPAETAEVDAGLPDFVSPPPSPSPPSVAEPPPPGPRPAKRVSQSPVVFKAPPGTVIQVLGNRYRPDRTYRFKVGTLKVSYTCPKASRARSLIRRIPTSRRVVYVALTCR